jgi:hypothetical protein
VRKYGKIWIWSILSTAVAALSMRFFNNAGLLTVQGLAGSIGSIRNSPWAALLMLRTFIQSLGTLAAVYYLLQFLRYHILPILFPPPQAPVPAQTAGSFPLTGDSAGPARAVGAVPNGANLLSGALGSIVGAMTREAVEMLSSIIYRAPA